MIRTNWKSPKRLGALFSCIVFLLFFALSLSFSWAVEFCGTSGSRSYDGFNEDDFADRDNTTSIDPTNNHLLLKTGADIIDKENIVIPSQQEVKATFLYEGAGYTENHFGYFLLSEAIDKGYIDNETMEMDRSEVESKINFENDNFDDETFHYIFTHINDNNQNGILDSVQGMTEAELASFDDGTELSYDPDMDGNINTRDMTKSLGLIGEGEEIIFFLVPNGNFSNVYFNKTIFNEDNYNGNNPCRSEFEDCAPVKVYELGSPLSSEGQCRISSAWLNNTAFSRLSNDLGIVLDDEDTYEMQICTGEPFSHLVVGAPRNDPDQWVLGWEDLNGGGDTDHNDVVFKVQRKTGGRGTSKIISSDISADPGTYITSLDFEATDFVVNCVSSSNLSCDSCSNSDTINFDSLDFQGQLGPDNDTVDCTYCDPLNGDEVDSTIEACSSPVISGSIDVTDLILSGMINNDFDEVDLATPAVIADASFSVATCSKETGPPPQCEATTGTAFEMEAPISVKIWAQDLSLDSSGNYSGTFNILSEAFDLIDNDTDADPCFNRWTGTVQKTVTLSGSLNGDWNTRKNDVDYFFSVDEKPIDDEDKVWRKVEFTDVAENSDGTKTKKAHLDLLGMGMVGNKLRWKAVMSNNDDNCNPPEIHNVDIAYDVAGPGEYSRSDPVLLSNVLYSGSIETPAADWQDKSRTRGHFRAYKVYEPTNPEGSVHSQLWNAGAALDNRTLNTPYNPDTQEGARKIYIAMGGTEHDNATIAYGDGDNITFSGVLPHGRILPGSVDIVGGDETLIDYGVNKLKIQGTSGQKGTIDRFTGRYDFNFINPPGDGVPIVASYDYYDTELGEVNPSNVTNPMLGIDATEVGGQGYIYDFDDDGDFDSDDRLRLIGWIHGFENVTNDSVPFNGTERVWPLGAIDHSTAAIVGPPGRPWWYYGANVPQEERDAYDEWMEGQEERATVAYVGARDGMLHAFDAGAFRQGDNPDTDIVEYRGYFKDEEYGNGGELWAFIPNNCLSRMKYHLKPNLENADPPYVDASPSVENISYIEDDSGEYAFKTVLLSAEGEGGDTIFALDVTEPENPEFLWEFASSKLFRSRSSPAIGKIVRVNTGFDEPKWVSFFVSGRTESDEHPAIFMVDVLQGELLKEIQLIAPDNQGAVLSGSPAILDSDRNGYIDRLYVGDNKGYMYRVNIPDDSTSTAFDLDDTQACVLTKVSQPIYASPTVYPRHKDTDTDGNIDEYHVKVMFGTGDDPYKDDNIDTANVTYKFYVFDDVCRVDYTFAAGDLTMVDNNNSSTNCSCSQMLWEDEAEWTYALPAGHRIWTEAYAAAGKVYFGTATSETNDPCSPQTDDGGNVYTVDLEDIDQEGEEASATMVAENQGNITNITGYDEHLYFKATTPEEGTRAKFMGDESYNNEPEAVVNATNFKIIKMSGSWMQVIPED